MQNTLTLLEQKKLQWAKEREELHGLWSPWGKPQESVSNSQYSRGSTSERASNTTAHPKGLYDSQSKCHLPPIGSAQQRPKAPLTAHHDPREIDWFQRKSSLPSYIQNPYAVELQNNNTTNVNLPQTNFERHRDYENENGCHTSGYFSENTEYDGTSYRSNMAEQTKNIYNSEYPAAKEMYRMDKAGEKATSYPSGPMFTKTNGTLHIMNEDQSQFRNWTNERHSLPRAYKLSAGDRGYNSETWNSNQQGFEQQNGNFEAPNQYNSLQNINNIPPPPPAMRSSFMVGSDGPQAEIYNMELQKQEKMNWIADLNRQREQQMIRKQMEKDEKRARWGDRGVGVGHLWEPSSPNSHLPSTPCSEDSYSRSPAWLEKSLNNTQNNQQEYNQFQNNPYPSGEFNADGLQNRNIPGATCSNIGNAEMDYSLTLQDRSFLRGHNVPVDPEVFAEKERKRLLALEHQEMIRKQIEERALKCKLEKEKRLEEEAREERRIADQRLKELQRMEAEQRAIQAKKSQEVHIATSPQYLRDEAEESVSLLRKERQSRVDQFSESQGFQQSEGKAFEILRDIEYGKYSNDFTVTGNLNVNTSTERERRSPMLPPQQHNEDLQESEFSSGEATQGISMNERSRSLSTSKEFGTQTDLDDKQKQKPEHRSQNSLAVSPSKDLKKEKPRWGENPTKKQYLKQSEKDPMYQIRLKKRMEREHQRKQNVSITRLGINSESDGKNHSAKNGSQIPRAPEAIKHRVDARKVAEPKRSPNLAKESSTHPINHGPTPGQRSRLPRIKPEPKIELLSAMAIEFDPPILPNTSEDESGISGTRFSSASLGSTYNFNSNFPTPLAERKAILTESSMSSSSPDSLDFLKGKTTQSLSKTEYKTSEQKFQKENNNFSDTQMVKSKVKKNSQSRESRNLYKKPDSLNPRDNECLNNNYDSYSYHRSNSPPVPAVQKRLREGIQLDPESYNSIYDDDRLPNLAKSQVRLQEQTYHTEKSLESTRSVRSIVSERSTTIEITTEKHIRSGRSHLSVGMGAEDAFSPRPSPRPSTVESEFVGRDILLDEIKTQAELSGRDKETGITDIPILIYPQFGNNILRDDTINEEDLTNRKLEDNEYEDPLSSEKKRATIRWIYSAEKSPKEALLTHLSFLKKGIQLEQQGWGFVSTTNTETDTTDADKDVER